MSVETTSTESFKTALKKATRGKDFEVLAEETGLNDTHVLRIVTPVWKRMHKLDRISKVQDAVSKNLPASEQKKMLRISVLTPEEWENVKANQARKKKTRLITKFRTVSGKKAAAPVSNL